MADIFNFSDLWTVGGTTYEAIKVDVTDTASAAASRLLNLSVGGTIKFSVKKDGHVLALSAALGGATIGTDALAVTGTANISISLAVGGATIGSNAFAVTGNTLLTGTLNVTSLIQDQVNGYFRLTGTSGANPTLRFASSANIAWASTDSNIGTWDTNLSRQAAGVTQFGTTAANAAGSIMLTNISAQTGYTQMAEMTAPAAGASDTVRIYAVDNGAGKTQLMALFSSGAAQQIAIQP